MQMNILKNFPKIILSLLVSVSILGGSSYCALAMDSENHKHEISAYDSHDHIHESNITNNEIQSENDCCEDNEVTSKEVLPFAPGPGAPLR